MFENKHVVVKRVQVAVYFKIHPLVKEEKSFTGFSVLARLDKVQYELLYYPQVISYDLMRK